jgi:hypothetical protein
MFKIKPFSFLSENNEISRILPSIAMIPLPDFIRWGTGIEFGCFPDGSAAILYFISIWRTESALDGTHCASALCKNNFRTKGVTYYTLPSDPKLRKGYVKVLMNENVNWQKHVICSAHWSTGRKSKDQLPDVICTQEYAEKIAEEYSKKPTVELKRKLKCTRRLLSSTSSNVNCTPRKAPASRTPLPSPPVKKRRISSEKLQGENATLKCQVETLTKELEEKRRCIDSLQQELTKLQTELSDNSLYYQKQLAAMRMAMEMKEFNYESLKQLPHKMFFYDWFNRD